MNIINPDKQTMKKQKLKIFTLDELTDKYIGKPGTPKRDAFEYELRMDIIGEAIRQARKERNLTQDELGQLVGVRKAQISKIENSLKDARLETIIKVFQALNARVHFNIELL
jgi:HTH-type transcriptional regulator / antitoxin HipB